MFTESPIHPSKQFVRRKSAPPSVPPSFYIQHRLKLAANKNVDVIGADRAKYFFPAVSNNNVPLINMSQIKFETVPSAKAKKKINKKVQTKFRESSAQTSPWEPSYVITDNSDPELLKLDFLQWGSGLPCGMHEIRLIERARMKRAWEREFERFPGSIEQKRETIAAMERDEWAFREQEIQDIQDLRLKLLNNMLTELHRKSKKRSEAKLDLFIKMKEAEKEEKLKKLQKKTNRELRKLEMKQLRIDKKYHRVSVFDETVNRASDIYGPQMRFGEHPKRWHQVIDESMKRFKAQFTGVEQIETLPKWLNFATKMKDCQCIDVPGTRLCMRETKWTTPVLKQLHDELKNLRKVTKRSLGLRVRISTPPSVCSTVEVEGIPDADEEFYQATITMQAFLKGRAAQSHIYEGRDRCRELINELRYSHGLLEEEVSKIHEEKLEIRLDQREEITTADKMQNMQQSLNKLQGNVAGSLLDFLNKELRRLLEERRAHAMCILLERERHNREAAEAGRRQLELRRRREHDEMFKQIVKVHQETIDLYLEDIIKEGMEFTSGQEAKDYIRKLAEKIDEEAYQSLAQFAIAFLRANFGKYKNYGQGNNVQRE